MTVGVLGIASVGETAVMGTFPVLVVVASLLTIAWLVPVGRGLLGSRWSLGGAARRHGTCDSRAHATIPAGPFATLDGRGMDTPPDRAQRRRA